VADIPQWRLVGDWFDVCSCDIPCPCEFAQPPTNNHCEGVLDYRIGEGHYGDVRLDGLNVLAVAAFDGNLWAGDADLVMGIFIDERGDERQREALQMIFGGQAGGWPATLAELIGEVRGIEFARIEVEVAGDHAAGGRVRLLLEPDRQVEQAYPVRLEWPGPSLTGTLGWLLELVEADDRASQHRHGVEAFGGTLVPAARLRPSRGSPRTALGVASLSSSTARPTTCSSLPSRAIRRRAASSSSAQNPTARSTEPGEDQSLQKSRGGSLSCLADNV
jgi:hypothetical protein